MEKKIRITLTIIAIVALLSVILGIGFATVLLPYNSYKHVVCMGKVLDFAQKGVIRDAGGFSGSSYECVHMKYTGSIYGPI
jgi:hypothetical protein